jgi:pyridoxine 4-dehydrogenase
MKFPTSVSIIQVTVVALASTLLERVDGFNTSTKGRLSTHVLLASLHELPPATWSRRGFVATAAATAATAGLWVPNTQQSAAAQGTSVGPIQLPPLGLGAWAWGDSFFWGYNSKNDDELQRVFDYAVANSKTPTVLFDTAELYGFGRSELLLGEFSKKYYSTATDGAATNSKKEIQIATKFAAVPTRTKPENVLKACEASLKRLGGDRPIDLYQIHFPNAWANEEYWDGLAQAYEKGLVKAVGVSNYGVDATRACHAALAKRGIPLSTNQIQLSLLYTHPLQNGLMDTCKELGVQVLSYSPLGLGMLTGKYTNQNPPQGPRQKLYEKLQETPDYANLLAAMDQVAAQHGSAANKAQVAINWARAKGSIPIPGARTVRQVQQNYNALDWSLTKDEERLLDDAAAKVKTFIQPSQGPFPRKDINTGLIMFDS